MSKRTVLIIAAVIIALSVGVLVSGGISYVDKSEYREERQTDGEVISVQIQNRARDSWGDPYVVGMSEYGPPFDLIVSARLPENTEYTTAYLEGFAIKDGSEVLATIENQALPVETFVQYGMGNKSYPKGFLFMKEAFQKAPRRVSVVGTVRLKSKDGSSNVNLDKTFQLEKSRALYFGERGYKWSQ